MKIALVHASDFGGGAERSVVSLHRSLLALGHESTLYVGQKLTDLEQCIQIPYIRGTPGMRRAARALERWNGWQDIYNPSFRALSTFIPSDTDVVHLNSLWGSQGFADLGALPRICKRFPTLITLRESWLLTGHCACFFTCDRWKYGCGHCPDLTRAPAIPRDGTRFNWLRKRRILQKCSLRVISISRWLQSQVAASPFFEGKTLATIYNGIDTRTFAPNTAQRNAARASLHLNADDVVMLVAGQSVEGIREHIAQQWVAATNNLSNTELVTLIIGKSASSVAENVQGRFKCLPFQETPEDMANCYRAADFTTVTSEFEAFGRIAAESQATGTPVVSFATGGLPEIVLHNKTGLVVPTGATRDLQMAIEKLVTEKDLRSQMSLAGVEHCRATFSDTDVADEYIQHYEAEVLARTNTYESSHRADRNHHPRL